MPAALSLAFTQTTQFLIFFFKNPLAFFQNCGIIDFVLRNAAVNEWFGTLAQLVERSSPRYAPHPRQLMVNLHKIRREYLGH